MDQYQFILEVHSRPCIWDPQTSAYVNRVLKRKAWDEVAAKIYQGYENCSDKDKIEKVRELQKIWKSVTDFYKRRNPNNDIDEKTKQKKPIIALLKFLNKVTTTDHRVRTRQRLQDHLTDVKNKDLIFQLPDYKVTVQKSDENQPPQPKNTRKRNRSKKKNLEVEMPQNEQTKFLLSLLPVMQSLNDRQRFEFKLQVMMLIKKIKFEDTQSNTEASQHYNAYFYTRPADYDPSMATLTKYI